jgi:hypothetical protein
VSSQPFTHRVRSLSHPNLRQPTFIKSNSKVHGRQPTNHVLKTKSNPNSIHRHIYMYRSQLISGGLSTTPFPRPPANARSICKLQLVSSPSSYLDRSPLPRGGNAAPLFPDPSPASHRQSPEGNGDWSLACAHSATAFSKEKGMN